jgi:hypothetical protein
MSYNEIIEALERNWAEIEESQYPEDLIREWAESDVPIYNSDIYRDWGSLPVDAQDEWREQGIEVSPDDTILSLMRIDLFLHIEGLYNRAYHDLLASKEGN